MISQYVTSHRHVRHVRIYMKTAQKYIHTAPTSNTDIRAGRRSDGSRKWRKGRSWRREFPGVRPSRATIQQRDLPPTHDRRSLDKYLRRYKS